MEQNQSEPLKNKKWLIIGFFALIFFVIKILRYNKPGQFFADIPLLILTMALLLKFRKQITEKIKKVRFPKFLLYLLCSIPLIIFEENVNCLQSTGCRIVPVTLPFLLGYVLILGIAVKLFKSKNIAVMTAAFSILGFIFELTIGASSSQLRAILFSPFGVFMFFWTIFSYAFLVVIPLTILMSDSVIQIENSQN